MHYVNLPNTNELARLPVLQLFRMGFDTARIALLKGKEESFVYNFLHRAREAERQQILELRTTK